jgi:hypothetical protein
MEQALYLVFKKFMHIFSNTQVANFVYVVHKSTHKLKEGQEKEVDEW